MSRLFFRRWSIGILVILLLSPDIAFAQGAAQDSIMQTVGWLIAFAMTVINVMMWPLFILLDVLLDPAVIFGAGSTLLDMLHVIWQFTRDIVNVIFAILLVGGAVYMIVTANNEKIKAAMAPFVMTVVLVNLSWFVPRVIYDVAQLSAYTVFQIPSLLGQAACVTRDETGRLQECEIVQGVVFFQHTRAKQDGQLERNGVWHCDLKPLVCYNLVRMSRAVGTSQRSWIMNGLIINHARLRGLAYLPDAQGADTGGGLENVGVQLMWLVRLVIVLAISIALFFPLLALVVMFFLRIPVLWLTMAFMPVVALTFVLPAGLIKSEFDPWEMIWKRFLNAAFLPALVAVPFAVGYIMLNAAMQMQEPAGGLLATPIPLIAGVNSIWQLLWMILSLFVLWAGVFMVLKGAKFAGEFGTGLVNAIEGMGKATAKLPLALPIIPVPKGDGTTVHRSFGGVLKEFDPRRRLADLEAIDSSKRGGGGVDQVKVNAAKDLITNNVDIRQSIEQHQVTQQTINNGTVTKQQIESAVNALHAHPQIGPSFSKNDLLRAILDAYRITNQATREQFIQKANAAAPAPPAAPATPAPPPASGAQPNPPPGNG